MKSSTRTCSESLGLQLLGLLHTICEFDWFFLPFFTECNQNGYFIFDIKNKKPHQSQSSNLIPPWQGTYMMVRSSPTTYISSAWSIFNDLFTVPYLFLPTVFFFSELWKIVTEALLKLSFKINKIKYNEEINGLMIIYLGKRLGLRKLNSWKCHT